jgi:hypothetical protein
MRTYNYTQPKETLMFDYPTVALLVQRIVRLEAQLAAQQHTAPEAPTPAATAPKKRKPPVFKKHLWVLNLLRAGETFYLPVLAEKMYGRDFTNGQHVALHNTLRTLERRGYVSKVKGRAGMWVVNEDAPTAWELDNRREA